MGYIDIMGEGTEEGRKMMGEIATNGPLGTLLDVWFPTPK